jgi:hypothetical protein
MNPFGFLLAMTLAFAGWSALSMAMDRHYADVYGRGAEPAPALRNKLRWLGSLAIVLTFAVCVAMQGWTIGPVGCLGFLGLAGLLQVIALTYVPARVPLLGKRLALAALVFAVCWWISLM